MSDMLGFKHLIDVFKEDSEKQKKACAKALELQLSVSTNLQQTSSLPSPDV